MIYTLEKRHTFGGGTMSTHWEVRSYPQRKKQDRTGQDAGARELPGDHS